MPRRMRIGHPDPGTFNLTADRGLYSITGNQADVVYSGFPGNDNDGLIVTNGATYDPRNAMLQSIDVNSNMPTAITSGAQVTYANEAWWSGPSTPVGTFYPPTGGDAYCGFGAYDVWRNATNVVRQINVRWEFLLSDLHLLDSAALPKWLIIDTFRELRNAEDVLKDRPMIFLAHMNEADSPANRIANALTAVASQDTVRCFQATNMVPAPTFGQAGTNGYQNNLYEWHVRATGGTASNGGAIVDNDEYMCIEVRVNVMGTSDEPNGVIAFRIYRRNGAIFERATAWTNTPNDQGERPLINTNYISRIDVGGGGYYNNASAHNSGLWTKIGRRLTISTNYQPTTGRAWHGPPTGFYT